MKRSPHPLLPEQDVVFLLPICLPHRASEYWKQSHVSFGDLLISYSEQLFLREDEQRKLVTSETPKDLLCVFLV